MSDETIPDAYDAADDAELSCGTRGGCLRDDCNGFLCFQRADSRHIDHSPFVTSDSNARLA